MCLTTTIHVRVIRAYVGKQLTVLFHVDNSMSSHVDPKVNGMFEQWLNFKYGSFGAVSMVRGRLHNYLGMNFHFVGNREVKIEMFEYIDKMLDEFPIKFSGETSRENVAVAGNDLFKEDLSKPLDEKQ